MLVEIIPHFVRIVDRDPLPKYLNHAFRPTGWLVLMTNNHHLYHCFPTTVWVLHRAFGCNLFIVMTSLLIWATCVPFKQRRCLA
ncbi:hypothetical protein ASPSYDRAFT_507397 [Aspergillus sydowii CBS 593.65]|uniref:Uncharacterized protein n=1 Tax=Aspergillus sydowii CBS 593.65 TaxID=1036612 RepID=A0A1L9T364_9EURO|nr:uncharacterized protein ASPSYDRAFT_507397 [Aspergillus sydowii CBS 593.65]OJJ53894.1 hypothetical protein ASPSYDRAFT_507397 [Aspergillus sydowii CBS 593.65]